MGRMASRGWPGGLPGSGPPVRLDSRSPRTVNIGPAWAPGRRRGCPQRRQGLRGQAARGSGLLPTVNIAETGSDFRMSGVMPRVVNMGRFRGVVTWLWRRLLWRRLSVGAGSCCRAPALSRRGRHPDRHRRDRNSGRRVRRRDAGGGCPCARFGAVLIGSATGHRSGLPCHFRGPFSWRIFAVPDAFPGGGSRKLTGP